MSGLSIANEGLKEMLARKEEALCGWVAYVAMANPNSPALTREYMHAMFGEWAWRAPRLERRDSGYFLVG